MTSTRADDTADEVKPWMAEARAHQRAMPLPRLLGNGMDYPDAVELHSLAEQGVPWADAAEQLGDRNRDRAKRALTDGHTHTAHQWYLFASACYRAGQVPLADTDTQKRRMYRKLIDTFGAAGRLATPRWEHVQIPFEGSALAGWLLVPPNVIEPPPVVIVTGGFDGWREEYAKGAEQLLVRGLACLLVDGPGQGETRIFGKLHMGVNPAAAFSFVVDYLLADPRVSDQIGMWGNSMGGYLAAATAAADPRIGACCVNGGTVRPVELPERYPRFVTKLQALYGIDDPDEAMRAMDDATIGPTELERLRCPLLVLHGTPDQVFLVENARALYDAAASVDKTWREWPDGDHCIYNHTAEKHAIIGDWFTVKLRQHTPTHR
ncbi:alpha/beta hydrolase family protein [Rhodococcus sp. T7]|uniref:alpha/beta hydrolase family protein n=1 Tax=Rhodococcus sp. T7 TaxID=627444 RepID=UPI00135753A9|nr:alpha/beta fold hydrolase [Rhodococcus sp. T7]KAF0960210.1 2,6-dihydropseudooxynicotine hydrolase [Rhodococcus sp. T7]